MSSTMGSRIRDKRRELGISVDELAVRLGKNRATIYRYESDGIEDIPISLVELLAKILQTDPVYLVGWNATDMPNPNEAKNHMKMLRKVRKSKGMTMKELGKRVGVSESAISQYETGKRETSFKTLLKICDALKCSVDYLLRGDEAEKNLTLNDEDGLDELDKQLISLLDELSRDQKLMLLAQLKTLIGQRK